MKRPSAAAPTVGEDSNSSAVAAPVAAPEDEDDQDEVDEPPDVMKRPSALRKPLKKDTKKKPQTKDQKKRGAKPSEVTYQNPSWHKSCNNWQLESNRGYIMSVACPPFIRFCCHFLPARFSLAPSFYFISFHIKGPSKLQQRVTEVKTESKITHRR